MMKHATLELTIASVLIAAGAMLSCSDDDGSNVQPNGMNVGGAAGAAGMGGAGGQGGSSGGMSMAGSGGAGAGGLAGMGGSAGCTPIGLDAGAPDAGSIIDAGVSDASVDGGLTGPVSFVADIHPIFVQRCAPCHTELAYGGHNVGAADVEAAYTDAVEQAEDTLLERVNGGGMPPSYAEPPNDCPDGAGPGDPGCLTLEEFSLLQTWVAQCYPR